MRMEKAGIQLEVVRKQVEESEEFLVGGVGGVVGVCSVGGRGRGEGDSGGFECEQFEDGS